MREELAALMHEIWGARLRYICDCHDQNLVNIFFLVEGWRQRVDTSYNELSEGQKGNCQREADKVLTLLAEKLLVANTVIERNPAQSMPERVAEAHYAMVGGNLDRDPVSVDVIARWLVYIEEGVKCEDPVVPVGANFDGDWVQEE